MTRKARGVQKVLIMCMVLVLMIPLTVLNAEPADSTHGVDVSGTTATAWFKPGSTMSWVDLHYKVNSGAQQNVRTTYNATNARYEYNIAPVSEGQVIDYSFTYFNGSAAYDTSWYSFTVVGNQVAAPTFSPNPSVTYTGPVNVTLSTTTAGADIYYTTDGSTPTASSNLYTAPFEVASTTTVQAIGIKAGMTSSAIVSATYTICVSGCEEEQTDHGVDVSGTTATAWYKPTGTMSWVDIHYKVNAGAQQNVRTAYNSAKARYEFNISPVAIGTVIDYSFTFFNGSAANDTPWYTFTNVGNQVAAPTFSPDPSATYTGPVNVTLSTTTAGSDIYYTTDGSTPTASSTLYTVPFEITSTTTVKAIGIKSGMTSSAVVSATYTICISGCNEEPTDHGVDVSGTTATAWYKPAGTMAWVDIHYKVNSGAQQNVRTTYDTTEARYEVTITPVSTGTVIDYSFTYFNGSAANDTSWYSYTDDGGGGGKVAAPVITLSGSTVTMSTATAGADIYYTTDGSQPTSSSNKYNGPFTVACGTMIHAVGVKAGMEDSSIVTLAYTAGCGGTDFSHGVAENGTTATIWFQSNVNSTWVDVHYKVNNGTVNNGSMTLNGSTGKFEQAVPQVATNDIITYSFTYNKGTGGVDSDTFTYTVQGIVADPVISPVGGAFSTDQQITIESTTADAVIYYTVDGSTPTRSSIRYTGPFVLTSSVTIKAIATKTGMNDSGVTTERYVHIGNKVAMPRFSNPGGTYQTAQTVSLTVATEGASIYYTTDGSTPTTSSQLYTGPITVSSSMTIKAIGAKAGMDSSNIASGAFIIGQDWDGMIFQLQNASNGIYPDSEVYWIILGYEPVVNEQGQTVAGPLCYINLNGDCEYLNESYNTITLEDNRVAADIFHTMAEKSWVKMPDLVSGRMYISFGSPVYIEIKEEGGVVGFGGPDMNNITDPNREVYFEFGEFTIINGEYWGNTTRVDSFTFPVQMRLTGQGGYDKYPGDISDYDKLLGDVGTRSDIFEAFKREVPEEFRMLVQEPYRIVAPGKGGFDIMYDPFTGQPYNGPHMDYFDAYIEEVWNYYRTHDLVFSHGEFGVVTGRVQGDALVLTSSTGESGIVNKPTTPEVLEGKGNFDTGSRFEKSVQAFLCAAMNRHVATNTAQWEDPQYYYQSGPANYYAKFWHDHGIDGLAYGFCYDDVYEKSTLLHYTRPQTLTYTAGW